MSHNSDLFFFGGWIDFALRGLEAHRATHSSGPVRGLGLHHSNKLAIQVKAQTQNLLVLHLATARVESIARNTSQLAHVRIEMSWAIISCRASHLHYSHQAFLQDQVCV